MSPAPRLRREGPLRHALALLGTLTLGGIVVLLGVGVGAGCSSCAHGATLTISGHAPGFDNAGTCAAPSLTATAPANLCTVVVQVSGPASFADSLQVVAGAPFTFTRTVPGGTYSIRSWARDAGGAGCDTTITLTVKNPPWRVRL